MLQKKLTQYIKDLGLSYKETSNSFIFTCPKCDGKDKLYIRKKDGRFICFKCGDDFKGKAEYAIIELTDIPIRVVKETLYGSEQEQASFLNIKLTDFDNLDDEDDEDDEDEVEPKKQLVELEWPYHCIPISHPGSLNGQKYLESRGISIDIASIYNIRYSPKVRAVVFPVYEESQLLGWQYRTIDKTKLLTEEGVVVEKMKAWSSPNLPRDKHFMFANRLKGANKIVLCEGPIDAIKCHLFGGNIAAMGKHISDTHISILLRSGIKDIYSGLDPDAFGELDSLLSRLGNEVNLYKVKVPEIKGEKCDLGALSMEDAYKAIMSAEKMFKNRLYVWLNPGLLNL